MRVLRSTAMARLFLLRLWTEHSILELIPNANACDQSERFPTLQFRARGLRLKDSMFFPANNSDHVCIQTDGIRTLFNEPIHEGEDEQEVDPKMRTSTSLQFNVGSEANKENSTGVPFFPQGIANPGLQDTPKHRPLSAIASTCVTCSNGQL